MKKFVFAIAATFAFGVAQAATSSTDHNKSAVDTKTIMDKAIDSATKQVTTGEQVSKTIVDQAAKHVATGETTPVVSEGTPKTH